MSIELDNSFTVPVPPEQAWNVLLDVQRIAPCMPGASVDEVNGDEIAGRVKVKVGPVSLTYKGTAKFTGKDADNHMVAVEAAGKETRGAGTASAVVQAGLKPDDTGNQTLVTMHTTLNVTGRPAQFGRGVMAEVSGKLVEQFAANLAQLLAQGNGTGESAGTGTAGVATAGVATASGADAASTGTGTGTGTAEHSGGSAASSGVTGEPAAVPVAQTTPPAQADSLNLLRLVGGPVLKRVIPVAAIAAGSALLYRLLRGVVRRSKA
ncbi:MAG: SRPBCC family protein [Streptosporangiaceae bacterium]|nr:SRPBCC family protein [Streptosporangiaceae bacterium]MBV9856504.1 SRPBCC family protein [Streptosporangiaceae bacterium]